MTLPKFIITMDGFFRLGMVNQHKDLLKPGDSCLGGGYYHFDYTSNRIILDRSSYDFGKPNTQKDEFTTQYATQKAQKNAPKSIQNAQKTIQNAQKTAARCILSKIKDSFSLNCYFQDSI